MKITYKQFKTIEGQTIDTKRYYENKFFGLFLNAYKFTGISREQERYLLKKMWQNGCVSAFIIPGTKPDPSLKQLLSNSGASTIAISSENDNGLIVFVPFAINQYNIYDEPSVVNLINIRGANFIPTKPMKVNEDVVIGWAHSSHAPIKTLVMYYIDKIVDVENTINTNLFVHKLPRLIVVSPEDKSRVEDLMEKIEKGEKKLFLEADDVQAIKNVLESGSNTSYIIDKLYAYKQSLENELLTFLGINNISLEKKERLITDEANANNQIINDSSDCFLDCMKDFCEDIKNILGYEISVEAKSSPESNEEDYQLEDEESEEKEDVE